MRLELYKIDVNIYLNKTGDNPRFEAELGGESIYDTDYVSLRKKINERARICFAADWKPIIEIHTTSPSSLEQEVDWNFRFRRFYYAVVGNSYRELSWDTYQAWKERGVDDRSELINASRHWMAAGTAENKGMPGDETKPRHVLYNGEEIRYQIGNYYRPYSEDLWNGLVKLRDVSVEAGIRLINLLGSDEGLALILKGPTLPMLVGRRSE